MKFKMNKKIILLVLTLGLASWLIMQNVSLANSVSSSKISVAIDLIKSAIEDKNSAIANLENEISKEETAIGQLEEAFGEDKFVDRKIRKAIKKLNGVKKRSVSKINSLKSETKRLNDVINSLSTCWVKIQITDDGERSICPSIAWDGSDYGIIWQQGSPGSQEGYFNKVDNFGNVIVPKKRLTTGGNYSIVGNHIWNGKAYAMVWPDNRKARRDTFFARFDKDGNLLTEEICFICNMESSFGGSIIWTGSDYGITWQDFRDGNNEIYFVKADKNGNKTTDEIRITNDLADSIGSQIVWTGSEFGIFWMDNRDGDYKLYFAKVNKDSEKQGDDIEILTNSWGSKIVWTGKKYGVTYYNGVTGVNEIYLALVSKDGVLEKNIQVSHHLSSHSEQPSIIWTGSRFGIVWHGSGAYFAEFNIHGKKTRVEKQISAIGAYPDITWGNSKYAITWNEDSEIYFTTGR
jgi:hypothetical protein